MPETVRITINGREIEIEKGRSILAASMSGGIHHMHLCGGRGLCTTCRVVVLEGTDRLSPMETYERVSLRGHLSFSKDVRLACQAKVLGPARVETLLPTIGRLDFKGR
jgi:adenylate cyclase